MAFWSGGEVLTLVWVGVLLAIAGVTRTVVPGWSRLAVPDAMIAGVVGLVLGGSGLGWMPLRTDILEGVVYHGLGVLFVVVGLRGVDQSSPSGTSVRTLAFALPMLIVLQALLGLLGVVAWRAAGWPLHLGVGLMVPLGFSQGPGQALSLGTAWEQHGMRDGGQIGLAMAAMGFLACAAVGAPLVAWGRSRGWAASVSSGALGDRVEPPPMATPGGLEPLTRQVAATAVVYLGVFAGMSALAHLLPSAQATIYGFHFLFGALLGALARALLARASDARVLDPPLLSRGAAVCVDVMTVAALAAVRLDVLLEHAAALAVFGVLATLLTLAFSLWLARWAFPERPFEYALVLYGSGTGTMATGLALLRQVDPELRGPVTSGAVWGSAASLPASLPLLVLLQVPGAGSDDTATLVGLAAALVVYGCLLAAAWAAWWARRAA